MHIRKTTKLIIKISNFGVLAKRRLKLAVFYPPEKYSILKNFSKVLFLLRKALDRALPSEYYPILKNKPIAVYDLRLSPPTYDFAYFLYQADCYFRSLGHSSFQVIIFSGKTTNNFICQHNEWESLIGKEERSKRIYNMLLPMASLYEGCFSARLIKDINHLKFICRRSSIVYPKYYDGIFLSNPISYEKVYKYEMNNAEYSGFKSNRNELDKVQSWLFAHNITLPFVCFTIRDYQFEPSRNSNVQAYLQFAKYLRDMNILSVFIPEVSNAVPEYIIEEFPLFIPAIHSLYQRQAIYELACTNIFANNGCSALCALNKSCSYILSGLLTDRYDTDFFDKRGLAYLSQPFCENRGIWNWGPETYVSLINSFNLLIKKNNLLLNLITNART